MTGRLRTATTARRDELPAPPPRQPAGHGDDYVNDVDQPQATRDRFCAACQHRRHRPVSGLGSESGRGGERVPLDCGPGS